MPNRPFDPEERRQQEILSTIRNMTANPAALSDPRAVKAMEQAAAATPEITNNINKFFDKLDQQLLDKKSHGGWLRKLHR